MSDNFILETNRLINNLPLFAVGSYKTKKKVYKTYKTKKKFIKVIKLINFYKQKKIL